MPDDVVFLDSLPITATGKISKLDLRRRFADHLLTRYLAVAAHYQPEPIIDLLNRYPFDAAILALNAADTLSPHSFINRLLTVAVEKQMGIIGMKIAARGRILSS